LGAALFATGSSCQAQQRIVANLPDAPTPKQQLKEARDTQGVRSKTTYDILARRSFFFPDLAYTNKPLNSRQKFLLAADESIAPSGLIASAMSAAISQANDSWPGYGQGWNGYGKRYGATLALNASTDMFGTFLLPSLLHHDPRYFVLSRGSFKQKIAHALKRVVVTPTDAGGQAINVSGLLGPLASQHVSAWRGPRDKRSSVSGFNWRLLPPAMWPRNFGRRSSKPCESEALRPERNRVCFQPCSQTLIGSNHWIARR
jgi:hypothetical protein